MIILPNEAHSYGEQMRDIFIFLSSMFDDKLFHVISSSGWTPYTIVTSSAAMKSIRKGGAPLPCGWTPDNHFYLPRPWHSSHVERGTLCVWCLLLAYYMICFIFHMQKEYGRLNLWNTTEEYYLPRRVKSSLGLQTTCKLWQCLKLCVLEVCIVLRILMCLFQFNLKIKGAINLYLF